MDATQNVAEEHPGIESIVRVELNHLVREKPHFIDFLPAREARDPAVGRLAILKSHREATVRIAGVAASDGAVSGDVPKKVARIYLDPLSLHFHPASPVCDELDALVLVLKSDRIQLGSRTVMEVRYGEQLASFPG